MSIRIGVAGWDYPDWAGVVYPRRQRKGFDRLAHIARYVDVVEINSTFYRPVAARVAESWVRRTAEREEFGFTAKAHRSWTHEREVVPGEVVPPTLDGLAPLRDAGKLGALLLQFPQSFHYTPDATERVERFASLLDGWPAVVEVRHASWNTGEAADWFRERRLGWCAVDQPRVGDSTLPPLPWVTSGVAYLRLHGRNDADWFRPGVGRDARYDYRYSEEQLHELEKPIREMAATAESLFVVQNNHFRGQALVNALQMKRMLEREPPAAPEELVAFYPDLEPQVRVERRKLF